MYSANVMGPWSRIAFAIDSRASIGFPAYGPWVASGSVSDEIRQAASLIGVRDAPGGPEVLVIERTLDHRFLPGTWRSREAPWIRPTGLSPSAGSANRPRRRAPPRSVSWPRRSDSR